MTGCLYPHSDDRKPHAATVGFLCKSGYLKLEQEIAEMSSLSSWLHANLAAGGTGQSDGSQRTKGEPPIPIRENVHDHIVEIGAVLTSWAALVAEERSLIGPTSPEVTRTAPFLLAHLNWCAGQPWIHDLATELADLTRLGHQLAPSRPQRRYIGIGCPDDDCPGELSRDDGADYIECRDCGKLVNEAEYGWFCLTEAERVRDASGWVTPELAAGRLGLNPKTVRSWAKRGLIAVVCAVLPGEHDDRWRVHPDEVAARREAS